MVIYTVMGTTGEYSDRSEWPVCSYTDYSLAKAHVEAAYKEAARIFNTADNKYSTKSIDAQAKIWDVNMQFDYTGTDYFIIETELRESLPSID